MTRFWAVLFVLVFTLPAQAAENLRHPELQRFEEQGGKVEFLGHAYGLDGWLLTKSDLQPTAAYTTPEGGLVRGVLINPEGNIETMEQLLAFKARMEGAQDALPGASAAPGAPKAEKFYAEVEKAPWAKVGAEDAPYLYMFFNVNCDHCQKYWKDLQPAIKSGKLQVRLAPFGAAPENRVGGAGVLSSKTPGEAWDKYIAGDKSAIDKDKLVDGSLAAVDANTALLKKWNVQGVPFTVYRRLTDGVVTVIAGRPDNIMLILADLIKREVAVAAPKEEAPSKDDRKKQEKPEKKTEGKKP